MAKWINDNTKNGVFGTVEQMVQKNVSTSTSIHNQISYNNASRRKKIRLNDDDQQNRRQKMKTRLLEKLKKKKAKKQSA